MAALAQRSSRSCVGFLGRSIMSMPGQTSVLNNYLSLSLLYDVDCICEWISSNHLTINVAKFKSMCISRSRSSKLRFTILVNSSPLEKVKCFKYLGLWISDDLTWSCHIESVCCKARQQLGFIYRFFPPHCDAGTILALYKSHVLPMLDYACIVWDPHLRKDQLLLESVQHFALKIASQTWNSDYQTLRTRYDLAPLVNRRSYFKLLATFKFVHGCIALVVIFFINNLLT